MNFIPRFLKEDQNLIFELSRRNIKQQYRGSFLGFVWTVLHPLLQMLIMWFVFAQIFGRDVYYPIYLLCGNIIFASLRRSTTMSLTSIELNRNLLLRTKVNPYAFSCSICIGSMIDFFFSLIALIPFMIWLSVNPDISPLTNLFTYRLVFILLMLPALWLFEYGVSLFLSVMYIFFKDLKHLYSVILVLWQYLTPIFYTVDRFDLNSPALFVIKLNPMYHFVTYFRECVYLGVIGQDPQTFEIIGSYNPAWMTLLYLYLFGIASTAIGVLIYKLLKKKVIVRL